MVRRVAFWCLFLVLLAGLAETAWAEVTIYGYVYYWNLEDSKAVSLSDDPNLEFPRPKSRQWGAGHAGVGSCVHMCTHVIGHVSS